MSLDLAQIEQLELNFGDVAQALQGENITMSGGELLVNGQRRAVRVIGEFKPLMTREQYLAYQRRLSSRVTWSAFSGVTPGPG